MRENEKIAMLMKSQWGMSVKIVHILPNWSRALSMERDKWATEGAKGHFVQTRGKCPVQQ